MIELHDVREKKRKSTCLINVKVLCIYLKRTKKSKGMDVWSI